MISLKNKNKKIITIHPGDSDLAYGYETSQLSRQSICHYLDYEYMHVLTSPQLLDDWKSLYTGFGFDKSSIFSVSNVYSDCGHEKLVNEERKRLGKTELKWSDGLYELSKLRATELGLNGNIRFWNDQGEMLKHVRDSKGTKWYEVARGTNFAPRALGENLAGFTLPRNVYKVFSEKFIAKQLYEQWRNSLGHYANMIDDEYTEFGFDLAYSKFWRNDGKSIDYLAQGIQGVQLFAV